MHSDCKWMVIHRAEVAYIMTQKACSRNQTVTLNTGMCLLTFCTLSDVWCVTHVFNWDLHIVVIMEYETASWLLFFLLTRKPQSNIFSGWNLSLILTRKMRTDISSSTGSSINCRAFSFSEITKDLLMWHTVHGRDFVTEKLKLTLHRYDNVGLYRVTVSVSSWHFWWHYIVCLHAHWPSAIILRVQLRYRLCKEHIPFCYFWTGLKILLG